MDQADILERRKVQLRDIEGLAQGPVDQDQDPPTSRSCSMYFPGGPKETEWTLRPAQVPPPAPRPLHSAAQHREMLSCRAASQERSRLQHLTTWLRISLPAANSLHLSSLTFLICKMSMTSSSQAQVKAEDKTARPMLDASWTSYSNLKTTVDDEHYSPTLQIPILRLRGLKDMPSSDPGVSVLGGTRGKGSGGKAQVLQAPQTCSSLP
nr:uncharacterized protein LOC105485153 [Macaca nemestrina]